MHTEKQISQDVSILKLKKNVPNSFDYLISDNVITASLQLF